ncbi:sortase domain-containing protein [Terrabacter terrigena]|uniref:Sortase domain-bontaining protein n=1 Tax=Terrabacter terrigena TaxID=574718 RepID=A0ABW3MWB4_9MICO
MGEQTNDPDRMPAASGRRVTSGVAAALATTVVLLVVGVVALVLGLRGSPYVPGPSGPPRPAAAPATRTIGAGSPTPPVISTPGAPGARATSAAPGPGGAPVLAASAPTLLEIPSVGVRSRTFVSLSVQGDGTISVPGTAQVVGLYDGGPTPGQLGPSVIAAHVDTPSGVPGIFYRLGAVRAGDVVRISRRDGTRLAFTVDKVAAYEKSRFPTDLVYKSDFRRAEVRLVTCGGPTDGRNEYRDNVIVFGHLTSVGRTRP